MESLKSYPWAESLKIPEEDFKEWQNKKAEQSFTFWLLKNKPIYKKSYFDWAVEYYQIPFIEDMFFERHLMTKKEWSQVKDLAEWSEERLPVAVWRDIVFIGCLDPVKAQKTKYNFKHYFVLTSSHSLQSLWLFQKQLSSLVDKECTKSAPPINKNTESKKVEKLSQQETFTPDLPVEKAIPLNPPLHEVALAEKNKKQDFKVLGAQDVFPEVEEERITESENSTFPGRAPDKEDHPVFMKDIHSAKIDKGTEIHAKSATKKDQPQLALEKSADTELTETSFSIVSMKGEEGRFPKNQRYDKLWNEAKAFFYGSLVLKVKGEKAYFLACSTGIKINNTHGEFADFKDYSLFKIVAKGHLYNGFVVDTPANKKFFSQIGHTAYPKCVIAIPIKNEKQELKKVFVGLSANSILRDKVRDIEKNVLNFFQSYNQKLSQAA